MPAEKRLIEEPVAAKTTPEAPTLSAAQWSALCTHLAGKLDQERATIARTLHDEFGGLLVAAKMDLGHVQRGLSAGDAGLGEWILRAQRALDAAVAAERTLVEQLQPGLLMHVGVFAALRWYVEHLNSERSAGFRTDLPAEEPSLSCAQRVTLYRAAQEALELGAGMPVLLCGESQPQAVSLSIAPLRIGAAHGSEQDIRLLAIKHRIAMAGGSIAINEPGERAGLKIQVPISG